MGFLNFGFDNLTGIFAGKEGKNDLQGILEELAIIPGNQWEHKSSSDVSYGLFFSSRQKKEYSTRFNSLNVCLAYSSSFYGGKDLDHSFDSYHLSVYNDEKLVGRAFGRKIKKCYDSIKSRYKVENLSEL